MSNNTEKLLRAFIETSGQAFKGQVMKTEEEINTIINEVNKDVYDDDIIIEALNRVAYVSDIHTIVKEVIEQYSTGFKGTVMAEVLAYGFIRASQLECWDKDEEEEKIGSGDEN